MTLFLLEELADRMGLTASQVRQDLNCFGGFGQQGYGYLTARLRQEIGAILGLGVRREWVGDILVQDHGAYVFCLPSVAPALLELEQVGRTGVKAAAVELAAVPVPERKVRPVTFTVQSARLDAVVSGMFRLSRTSAAAQIRAGAVHLNYAECLRPDAPAAPGDVLSLRGAGKGSVTEVGGMSRKGRQFVTAELWQ